MHIFFHIFLILLESHSQLLLRGPGGSAGPSGPETFPACEQYLTKVPTHRINYKLILPATRYTYEP